MQNVIERLEDRRLFAAGGIDTTFGTGGRALVQYGQRRLDTVYASAVQSDGKVIVAGSTNQENGQGTDLAVIRLNPDATLDQTFGITLGGGVGGGLFELPLDSQIDNFFGVAIQPDGRVILVGSIGFSTEDGTFFGQAVVIRLTERGTPDDTFGVPRDDGAGRLGFVFLPFSTTAQGLPNSEARAVALQSDGNIIIAGAADIGGGVASFAAARLFPDGRLDMSFGGEGTGIRTEGIDGLFAAAFGVAVDPSDRIYITGTVVGASVVDSSPISLFVTARLNPDGLDDITFGDEGSVVGEFVKRPQDDYVLPFGTTLAIQPDGKVITGGFIARGDNSDAAPAFGIALTRHNSDGSVDRSFGRNGVVETYVGTVDNPQAFLALNQILLRPDGKFTVAGRASFPDAPSSFNGAVVARYNANGTLDRAFNRTGIITLRGVPSVTTANANEAGFSDNARRAGALVAEIPGAGTLVIRSQGNQTVVDRLISDGVDLVTRIESVPGTPVAGTSTATLRMRVSNQGTLRFNGLLPITLRLSTDNQYSDDDTLITTQPISQRLSLSNGTSRVLTLTFTVPQVETEGNRFIVATSNEARSVVESNFLNNTAGAPVLTTVRPGFVQINAEVTAFPTSLRSGRTGSFSVRLTNTGTLPAVGDLLLQLFASTDTEFGGDTTLFPTTSTPTPTRLSLPPGQRSFRFSARVPRGLAPGTYNLILRIDATGIPGIVAPTSTRVLPLTVAVI
jgi:uncharacterized delta-60 repeat protein